MEPEILATLLGVALAALVAACGAGFRWLRSDFNRLDSKLDRLETKVDSLLLALAHSGVLSATQSPTPTTEPSETASSSHPQQTSPTGSGAQSGTTLPA